MHDIPSQIGYQSLQARQVNVTGRAVPMSWATGRSKPSSPTRYIFEGNQIFLDTFRQKELGIALECRTYRAGKRGSPLSGCIRIYVAQSRSPGWIRNVYPDNAAHARAGHLNNNIDFAREDALCALGLFFSHTFILCVVLIPMMHVFERTILNSAL
jgi:hypothetical protein